MLFCSKKKTTSKERKSVQRIAVLYIAEIYIAELYIAKPLLSRQNRLVQLSLFCLHTCIEAVQSYFSHKPSGC